MLSLVLARSCARAVVRHPAFLVLLLGGAGFTFLSRYFVLFGFGHTEGMLREAGLATITLVGMLTVLFFGTGGMDQDRPANRDFLLAKPLTPWQYILGRYLGVITAVFAGQMFILAVLSLLLLRVGSGLDASLVAGAFLSHLLVGILAGFAVALSLFLPLFLNIAVLLGIYVLGHLAGHIHPAGLPGRWLHALLPNLENFNASPAVARGMGVPFRLVALDVAYGLVYTLMVLVAAVALSAWWRADPH